MKSFWGGLLLAIGLAIMALCGLCTGFFVVSNLIGAMTAPASGNEGIIILALVVGGVPFVIGLALFILGRAILRTAREEDARAMPASAPEEEER